MSSLLVSVEPREGFQVNPTPVRELNAKYAELFPPQDIHSMASSLYRRAATNIYKTSDDQFIHGHGSLNPGPTIAALGMPEDLPEITVLPESYKPYMGICSERTATGLEVLLNEDAKQACTIVRKREDFLMSEHGRANTNTALYEVHHMRFAGQAASWPLAGLKVVDLTRVIAGPSISRGLAELGASVMRVVALHLPYFTGMHPYLNWGKWNAFLDLRKAEDYDRLRRLMEDFDVVVDGYRPGRSEKYGFGMEKVMEMCRSQARGIIYARENSYGWHGPWKYRMGGVIGCTAVIQALTERGAQGGSYVVVDIALNHHNSWLADICGEYPKPVWEDVWTRNGRHVFRHYEIMNVTVPAYLGMIKRHSYDVLFLPEFFERRLSKALNIEVQVVKPVVQYPTGSIELGYNVGTRGNGVD
ncbi:hypothetical protein COCVIDRAFT_43128 [Bipolaris victoriae FI3]|uniref:Uncharacterized protein n=1 Tax=Bipolaris victoriae (strain FI3) TaxID=930091 RepID=W7E9H6_BIPV3|nr:hypothetical protein COCVIDRAFT_43128 [Bipolaris victoriae FI3]